MKEENAKELNKIRLLVESLNLLTGSDREQAIELLSDNAPETLSRILREEADPPSRF